MSHLLEIQRDGVSCDVNRKWSSEDALLRQVSPEQPMYLCPLFRERRGTYRSGLWYAPLDELHQTSVLLVDVRKELLADLPEVSGESDLKRVVIRMFAGAIEGCIFEDIW